MLGGPVILGNIFALTSSIVMDKRKYIAKNPVHTFYLGHHTKGNRTLSSFSEQKTIQLLTSSGPQTDTDNNKPSPTSL